LGGGAVVLGVLAAAVFLAGRDDEPAVDPVPVAAASPGDGGGEVAATPVRRYRTPAAIQTTVPDVLGYPERTAVYTLENGGFRVRVMEHAVQHSSEDGVVVQQLPRAGVTRRVGWTITIYVGRRP
jgi:hypothetical protein